MSIVNQITNMEYDEVSINDCGLLYHRLAGGFVVVEYGPTTIASSWDEYDECEWYLHMCLNNQHLFFIRVRDTEYDYHNLMSDEFPIIVSTELGYYPFDQFIEFAKEYYKQKACNPKK